MQRGAKQRQLIPGHHHSSSGMIRLSTVRPPGETVVKLTRIVVQGGDTATPGLATECHG